VSEDGLLLIVRCLAHDNSLTRLRGIRLAREWLSVYERETMDRAHYGEEKLSWATLGRDHGGVSGQAVSQRFGRRSERRDAEADR
jgi:hypothetical protein